MYLEQKLKSLKPKLVEAVQEVIDSWNQNDEGIDEEFGSGGACDAISKAMAEVISKNIDDSEIIDGGQDGDDHSFLIVYDANEACAVDIPSDVYEIGGGYRWRKIRWRKIKDAKVSTSDVMISKIERSLIPDW